MEEQETTLIQDFVDLEILSIIDEKSDKNITGISKESGYTYKSTFHHVKKMNKNGWITPHSTKDITEGITYTINPTFKKRADVELRRYRFAKDSLSEIRKDKKQNDILLELLKFIDGKRLVSDIEMSTFIWEKYHSIDMPYFAKAMLVKSAMIRGGLLRSRLEVTRSGKQFLKNDTSNKG